MEGATTASIAQLLGRSVEAVAARCRQLLHAGELQSRRGRAWGGEEDAILMESREDSTRLARLMQRSPGAIKCRRQALGYRSHGQRRWLASEDEILVRLRDAGVSQREIAEQLERSEASVAARVSKLLRVGTVVRLPAEEQQRRRAASCARSSVRWTEQDLETVRRLHPTHSAEQIAVKVGRSRSAVNGAIGKLIATGSLARLDDEERAVRLRAAQDRRKAADRVVAAERVRTLGGSKDYGYVVGVLYGDGFITIPREGTTRRSGTLGLKTTDSTFAAGFAEALEATFQTAVRRLERIEPLKRVGGRTYRSVHYYEVFLHDLYLALELWAVLGPTAKGSWRLDLSWCLGLGPAFCDGLLQGFFDSEGSVDSSGGRLGVVAATLYESGLRDIHALAKARGLPFFFNGPDKGGEFRTGSSRKSVVRQFASQIGSRIARKSQPMESRLAESGTQFCLVGECSD